MRASINLENRTHLSELGDFVRLGALQGTLERSRAQSNDGVNDGTLIGRA
jgi:hypothetical protein